MKIIKIVLIFMLSVSVSFLLASISGTQVVLADVSSFGLKVSFTDRISTTIQDIAGLSLTLPILIGAAFLIAFLIAALCNRFIGGNRSMWYLAAGFSSLPLTLILTKILMGGTLFAAARSGLGLLLFAFSGLVGAWVFAHMTQKKDV